MSQQETIKYLDHLVYKFTEMKKSVQMDDRVDTKTKKDVMQHLDGTIWAFRYALKLLRQN